MSALRSKQVVFTLEQAQGLAAVPDQRARGAEAVTPAAMLPGASAAPAADRAAAPERRLLNPASADCEPDAPGSNPNLRPLTVRTAKGGSLSVTVPADMTLGMVKRKYLEVRAIRCSCAHASRAC